MILVLVKEFNLLRSLVVICRLADLKLTNEAYLPLFISLGTIKLTCVKANVHQKRLTRPWVNLSFSSLPKFFRRDSSPPVSEMLNENTGDSRWAVLNTPNMAIAEVNLERRVREV